MPASIRRALGLAPGAILEWIDEGGRIVVRRSSRNSSQDVHQALFPEALGDRPPTTLPDDAKQGIRRHLQRRHARG